MTLKQDIRTVRRAAGGKTQRITRQQRVSIVVEARSAVQKFAKRNPAVAAMVRDKSALTRFLTTVAKIFGKRTVGKPEIEAAVRILLAAGFEVRPGQRAGRGEKPGTSPPKPTPPPFSTLPTGPRGVRPRGDEIVTAEFADDPVLAEIVGDGVPVDPQAASRARQEAARVHLVDSSNVHSFYYVRTQKTGTLYVTFLKWTPGSKARSGPGPTYAYFDVPVRKYLRFKQAAKGSAGKAVWDYLRVRGKGNKARHQHQYALTRVAALGVRDLDAHVPRKVTRTGFRTRNLPDLSGRSTLRPKAFRVKGNAPERTTTGGRTRYI